MTLLPGQECRQEKTGKPGNSGKLKTKIDVKLCVNLLKPFTSHFNDLARLSISVRLLFRVKWWSLAGSNR